MSDSGDSDNHGRDTLADQTPVANTGPLVSVHVDNLQVSTTQENEEAEPDSGEPNDNRRRANRPVDSAMYKHATTDTNITFDRLSLDAEAPRNEKRLTGPRRMHTAPVSRPEAERQQSLRPVHVERVQGVPALHEDKSIDLENSCVCGLFQCKSMDGMWLRGGSLQRMDNEEQVEVERAARFGDCCRIYCLLAFIVVTNKRFIVKQLKKVGPFNLQSREESYHFSDLQHVAVERGLGMQRVRNRALTVVGLSVFAAIGFVFEPFSILLTIFALIAGILYAVYNLIIFICLYNVNFLVIDVARPNSVGSWTSILGVLTRGRNYHSVRVALHIDACFTLMNELLKKHPSLPLSGDNI